MAEQAPSTLSAPQQHGLLRLPNELLLHIISYLRPTENPVTYLKALVFRPYYPYYADTSRSRMLRSLTRTCRRLHIVTEMILADERDLERNTLKDCRAKFHRLTSQQVGSRAVVETWLHIQSTGWMLEKCGSATDRDWNWWNAIITCDAAARQAQNVPMSTQDPSQPYQVLLDRILKDFADLLGIIATSNGR